MKNRKGYPLGARIKRLMQTDDEVGKIASATPVVVGRAMELFLKKLCDQSAQVALARQSKTLLGSHIKSYVLSEPLMDFIKATVSSAPDLNAEDDPTGANRAKRPRPLDASDESTSTAGGGRGRGRPPGSAGRGRARGRPPLARQEQQELHSHVKLARLGDNGAGSPEQSHVAPPSLQMSAFAERPTGLSLHAEEHPQSAAGAAGIEHPGCAALPDAPAGSSKRILLDLNELPTPNLEACTPAPGLAQDACDADAQPGTGGAGGGGQANGGPEADKLASSLSVRVACAVLNTSEATAKHIDDDYDS